MADRESVIEALKCCKRKDGNECKVCPYTESEYCVEDMVTDVLKLLKEQADEIKELRLKEAMEKRDAFLSDENGERLNKALQSLWGDD